MLLLIEIHICWANDSQTLVYIRITRRAHHKDCLHLFLLKVVILQDKSFHSFSYTHWQSSSRFLHYVVEFPKIPKYLEFFKTFSTNPVHVWKLTDTHLWTLPAWSPLAKKASEWGPEKRHGRIKHGEQSQKEWKLSIFVWEQWRVHTAVHRRAWTTVLYFEGGYGFF